MKHLRLLLPSFLSCVLILAFLVTQANATDYNWIENAGFEYNTSNILLNAGFEDGTEHPYWAHLGTDPIVTWNGTEGFYCAYFGQAGAGFEQTLTTPIDTDEISSLQFYVRGQPDVHWQVVFTYNDSTVDMPHTSIADINWHITGASLSAGKFLSKVAISQHYGSGYHDMWVDNVTLNWLNPIQQGQSDIETYTLPWFSEANDTQVTIVTGYARSGAYSAKIYRMYGNYPKLMQNINYMPVNNCTEASLYAKIIGAPNPSATYPVRILIIYSDGTYTLKDSANLGFGVWTLCNYTSFLTPNKFIKQIQIQPRIDQYVQIVIDDVVLKSNVDNTAQPLFSWTLSPTPLSQTNWTFSQYKYIQVSFLGQVYNTSGYGENGSFSASLSLSPTPITGTITNGAFSFTITARSGAGDTEETMTITIDTQEIDLISQIVGHWIGTGTTDQNIVNPTTNSDYMAFWLINFFLLFFPAIALASAFNNREMSPTIGFVVGLAMSSSIGLLAGITPLWLTFMMYVCIVLLIIASLKWRGQV